MKTNNAFQADAGYTEIPADLKECMKDDASSVNTVGWIIRIEKWGKILIIILTIIGILESYGLGVFYAQIDVASHKSFSIVPCLLVLGVTLIIDFIVYILFQVIRLHLITQAELVNNTKMAAKLIAYFTEKNTR